VRIAWARQYAIGSENEEEVEEKEEENQGMRKRKDKASKPEWFSDKAET
jgi:hypothetical protein